MKKRIDLICAVYMALILCLVGVGGFLLYQQEQVIESQKQYASDLFNHKPEVRVVEFVQLPPEIVVETIYVDRPVDRIVEIISQEQVEELVRKDATILRLEKVIDWKNRLLTFELGDNLPYEAPFSDVFDCDDRALLNYLYFSSLHYEPEIVHGNLDRDNETRSETNHVWILVESDNVTYAYDYDYDFMKNKQYLEGYRISYKKLLYWAMADQ